MLTVHAAPLVLPVGAAAIERGAVAVEGDRIVALGPYDTVVAAHPAARVRQWPGVIAPGLLQRHAAWLLTRCYHPDPREADELGVEPLSGEAFARLTGELDATRWAGSVRRGLQQLLRYGTTHLTGPFRDPAVRTAVSRSGLVEVSADAAPGDPAGVAHGVRDGGADGVRGGGSDGVRSGGPDGVRGGGPDGVASDRPDLDPFAGGRDLAGCVHGPLVIGARADLAVFDVPDEAALVAAGAGSCVVTVLAGRLVYRRR
ncbi:imidazolonepropionase-like domain-containing protein [Streptomyces brevispora]|uniref:imidazolonepropionase-like domain-containing protein n=1 Tax=Streptomyces brevispora TaxID=887462 RepID=UPI0035DD3701